MAFYIEKMSPKYSGLTRNFRVNPGSCNNPTHYEEYLKYYAQTDQICGLGVTHLFITEDETKKQKIIAGFITLKSTSLIKIFDEYDEGHGALEITELAIDMNYERRGLGTLLVQYAITIAANLKKEFLGIEYVVLCADPEAVKFYSRPPLEFKKLEEYYSIPREDWNRNCTPMLIKLPNS